MQIWHADHKHLLYIPVHCVSVNGKHAYEGNTMLLCFFRENAETPCTTRGFGVFYVVPLNTLQLQ